MMLSIYFFFSLQFSLYYCDVQQHSAIGKSISYLSASHEFEIYPVWNLKCLPFSMFLKRFFGQILYEFFSTCIQHYHKVSHTTINCYTPVIKLNQSTWVNEHQAHSSFHMDFCAVNLSSLTHPVNSWAVGLRPVSCEGVGCPPRYRTSPSSIRYSVLPLNCVELCQIQISFIINFNRLVGNWLTVYCWIYELHVHCKFKK